MSSKLKYSLLFIYLSMLCYIVIAQLTTSLMLNLGLSFVIAVLSIFLLRKHIALLSFSKLFFILSFLIIIYFPMLGEKEKSSLEKRSLAEFPTFQTENIWKVFFQFQDYFNDRFAYRNISVMAINKFKFIFLNISPLPQKVLIGKENWLYNSGNEYIECTSVPYTNDELKTIKINLQIVTKWFDNRGIKYYFMIAPVKSRIYPENMPIILRNQLKFSKLDQVYTYLQQDTIIKFIDCRKELIEGKNIRPTYYITDTHWNEYGAFLAYQKVMQKIQIDFPDTKILQAEDFTIDSSTLLGGDLQTQFGFSDQISSPIFYYHLKNLNIPQAVGDYDTVHLVGNYFTFKMENAVNHLKIFVVRDSYSEHLRNFLSPTFKTSTYAWMETIPVSRVIDNKPDIVLHEMLEYFVNSALLLPPEIANDKTFMNKYFPHYHSGERNVE